MRFLALACDYDGTIAHHGRVDAATLSALQRVRESGRRLLLVTGRELDDLQRVFPHVAIFDRVVAENGALLYDPTTREETRLAEAPPPEFARELERRGVTPLSVGRVIVATWEPHDPTVLSVIRDMGLELQVIFNKGAVMVLPSGINKATGLKRALDSLKLSPHNTVSVGDAENDHALLAASECGVAVANALDSVKSRVDYVTASDHGAGVAELVDLLVRDDLASLAGRLTRYDLLLGQDERGADVRLPAHHGGVLVSGPSGSGKSTMTTLLLERLCGAGYQFCVIDPEGDYHELPGAIALRGADDRALVDEVLRVLDRPGENAVASLFDLKLEDRPAFLQALLPRLLELRAASARPHWIVIDEAHHLMPAKWEPSAAMLPAQMRNVVLVTVHADHVSPAALRLIDSVILVGQQPQETLDAFTRGLDAARIVLPAQVGDEPGAWLVRRNEAPLHFRPAVPLGERRRHQRKYAEGELGEDKSFYFRGPDAKLNLRAQNLELFVQLAEGVDDATWEFHLRNGDVTRWFRESIKDDGLAAEADAVAVAGLPPRESRARIRAVVEARYTAPA